jgi:hypothetical protein
MHENQKVSLALLWFVKKVLELAGVGTAYVCITVHSHLTQFFIFAVVLVIAWTHSEVQQKYRQLNRR